MEGSSAGSGGAAVGAKRKRVAFDIPATDSAATDLALPPASKRKAAAGAASSSKFAASTIDFDDDGEDAVVDDEVVKVDAGAEVEGGSEDEEEGEKGAADVGEGRLGGDDDDDDEEEAGRCAAGARRLTRVRGEQRGRGGPDFNETGDAFEPFHLRNEREEGHFTEAGDFVWKKKAVEDQDPWLDSLDAMDPRERAAMQTRAASGLASLSSGAGAASAVGSHRQARTTGKDDDEDDGDDEDASDGSAAALGEGGLAPAERVRALACIRDLLLAAAADETVTGALRRLSGGGGGGRGVSRGRAGGGAAAGPSSARDMAAFNRLTEAADRLISAGVSDVYGWRRKDVTWALEDACDQAGIDPRTVLASQQPQPPNLHQQLLESAATVASAPPDAAVTLTAADSSATAASEGAWEYKWDLATGAPAFGPFPWSTLRAWGAAGFFSAARPIFVRPYRDPAGSKAAPQARPATDGVDGDEGDIFSGAGTYDVAAVAAQASSLPAPPAAAAAEWRRFDHAGL